MQFFKPSLYLRYSSSDAARAGRADAEWEEAVHAYHTHLGRLSAGMNDRVRALAEDFCMHDAELLSMQQVPTTLPVRSPVRTSVTIVSLKAIGRIINLVYLSWADLDVSASPEGWPLPRLRPRWLCDEIDREPGPSPIPRYGHRILLSDGREITVPFYDVVVHSFPEPDPEATIGAAGRGERPEPPPGPKNRPGASRPDLRKPGRL